MVNEQIVKDTIKRMLDADIAIPTIVSTLKDIGMSEEEARSQIDEVKESMNGEDDYSGSAISNEQNEKMTQDDLNSKKQEDELGDTMTHNMLDLHERQIEDVAKKVDEVRNEFAGIPKNNQTNDKVPSNIDQKLTDISAQTSALMRLMKDILEVNRKILSELEMKK